MMEKISVLYIDDEPALLDISKQFLEKGGEFAVETVDSAAKALEIFLGRQYDAIVSDFQMPDMTGLELLKKVRESGSHIPFIIFTGKGREEVAIDALNSGADFYLQKGGDPRSQFAELSNMIHLSVNRRKKENGHPERGNFEQYINAAPDMISVTDTEGVVRYANSRVAEIFRATPESLIGKTQEQLFSPEIAKRHREEIHALLERGTPGSWEEQLTTPSGEFWISVNDSPVRDSEGKIISVLSIARDITRPKQLEESLRLSNQKLTTMLSATRHDINNKLTIVSGYMQLMKLESPGTRISEYLTIMERATSDISKLLKFTKEYEKLRTEPAGWLNVHEIFRRTVAEIPPGAVSITNELAGITILADPMLERAFSDILDNALLHGEKVTGIHARYEQRGADLVLIIEDNGIGIPADKKTRIFNRGAGKNTGLGLFLVREILAVTGLEITETGEPGKGARFEIRVPAGKFRLGEAGK